MCIWGAFLTILTKVSITLVLTPWFSLRPIFCLCEDHLGFCDDLTVFLQVLRHLSKR